MKPSTTPHTRSSQLRPLRKNCWLSQNATLYILITSIILQLLIVLLTLRGEPSSQVRPREHHSPSRGVRISKQHPLGPRVLRRRRTLRTHQTTGLLQWERRIYYYEVHIESIGGYAWPENSALRPQAWEFTVLVRKDLVYNVFGE